MNNITNLLITSGNVFPSSSYTGNNLIEIIDGIDQLLTIIQSGIDTQVYANQLPLLGDKLKDSTDTVVDFVSNFEDDILSKLHAKLDSATTKTPALVREALLEALGPNGLNLLQDLNGDSVIDIKDISSIEGTDNVDFTLKLKKNQTTFSSSLDTDIGLPKLGLTVDGQGQIGLGYDFTLKFGVNKTNGFYFDTSTSNELNIGLDASLPGLNTTGKLGILQVKVTDNQTTKTKFNSTFNVNFKDADNRLYKSELPSVNLGNLVDTTVTGNADVNLNLVTSFGDSAVFPSVISDFNLDWNFNNANAEPAQQQTFGTISRVGFDNVKLDLGSFFGDFAEPVLEKVQTITQPIQPILDVLNKPINLKITKITLLDILKDLGYIDQDDKNLIESLSQLATLINSIPSSSLQVNLGSFDLGTANVRAPNFSLSSVTPSNTVAAPPISQQLNGKPEGEFITSLNNIPGKGLEFPILTNSKQEAFNLLLGKNVNLFTYDLPKFQFTANYESPFIRIWGPFGLRIKGSLAAGIDLAFGYDTQGITDFANDTNPNVEDLFNGFYVSDRANPDGTGADVPELTLDVALKAYGAANLVAAEAGVGGGIGALIGFDLKDPNNDGKVRFQEFKTLLNNPDSMFCISGELYAQLSAYLTVGYGWFSYTKTFDSPRKTFLNYNNGCAGGSNQPPSPSDIVVAQSVNGNLQLNLGPNAAARNVISTKDKAEIFTIQHKSGNAGNETLLITATLLKDADNTTVFTTKQYNSGAKIVGNGGADNDQIALSIGVVTPAQLSGGVGNDVLTGGDGADVLNGDAGLDSLRGGGGNDTLSGGTENDWLVGGAGADSLNGGDGFDIASYSTAPTGVTVNLATGVHTGDATGDKFQSIEQIDGSPNNDNLTGGTGNDILNGAEGNDNINGGDGDDILTPGRGDDVINGGNGTDTLVIDYSTLPTQAVAWVEQIINDGQANYSVYVRNAWGIGAPIKNLSDDHEVSVDISDDGTTLVTRDYGYAGKLWVKKIHSNAPAVAVAIRDNDLDNLRLSGNGSKVVWASGDDLSDYNEIWGANTDGTQVRQLTNNDLYDGEVTISADGSTIAWIRTTKLNNQDPLYKSIILVANADGSNVREVVNDAIPKENLSLSADGSKIAWHNSVFEYNISCELSVWVANTDGTNIREVFGNIGSCYWDYEPSMSADGSKVVWKGYDSGKWNIYAANTDGSHLWTVPNTEDAYNFTTSSLSGDGERVVFSKYDSNDGKYKIYVTSVDGTEPPILIDTNTNPQNNPVISTYVDKGVSYNSFNPTTGSGEIFTWGPSLVRYSNIERFDITGTQYDDDLRGGNLDDNLTGGGGADTLKGALGNDTYSLNPQNAAGSQIVDTGGTDTLKLKVETTDSNGFVQLQDFTLSIAVPSPSIAGMRRAGTTLILDLNKDGIASQQDDLSILNFFNSTATGAGTGFLETISNLTGAAILSSLQQGNDTISGSADSDLVNGGAGNDQLKGNAGNDTLRGDGGNDALLGGEGNDTCDGGAGNDTLTPANGDDLVNGGAGTDVLVLDYSALPTRMVAWSKEYYKEYLLNGQLTGEYRDDFFVGNAFGLGTPLKMGEDYYRFALSDDGTTYAFEDSGHKLWVKKIGSPDAPIKITDNTYYSDLELSGNGSKIAWKYYDSLFVANSNGTGKVQIANTLYLQDFSLSNDGSQIAWIDDDGLFVANSNGTNIRKIISKNDSDFLYDIYLSANGSQIGCNGYRNGESGIWWANTSTNLPQIKSLVKDTFSLIDSNGIKAIWLGDETGNYQLLNVSSTTNTDVQEVADSYWNTQNQAIIGFPVITASLAEDGAKVAFAKPMMPGDENSLLGLYVADPYRTGTTYFIDNSGSESDHALGKFDQQLELSSFVNMGVSYNSFNPTTGSGEIFTWGPSLVRYSSVERFDITGTAYGDDLRGGNLSDTLKGGKGNDTISPGLGVDSVDGGAGTDTLVVNYSSLTTSANITTAGNTIGNGSANITTHSNFEQYNITTGAGADQITTGAGADTLVGGAGNDTLVGGAGDDTYVVDNPGDNITENLNSGIDTVQSTTGTYTLGANLENLTLTGTANIKGTGNNRKNIITGNSGKNTLNGGAGNDTLIGGAGNDNLIGGAGKDNLTGGEGNDKFNYKKLTDSLLTNFDVITDFNAGGYETASVDQFLVTTARAGFSYAGSVSTLNNTAITAILTTSNFAANYAAQFSFGSRTFVAINDGVAGFSASTDAIVEITGFTGDLEQTDFVLV